MEQQKHTPGPWHASHAFAHVVYGPNAERICRIFDNPADSDLIAAAPELLAVCKYLLREVSRDGFTDRAGWGDMLRAAIAGAELTQKH